MTSSHRPTNGHPASLWAALLCLALIAAPAATARNPPEPPAAAGEAAYRNAVADYTAGHYQEALAILGRAGEAGGWTVPLRSLAGWCLLRGGEIGRAEAEFKAALAIDPEAVDPRIGLSYVLLRRGSPAESEPGFRSALRGDPGNLDALKGLGLALRDQKKYAEAARVFREALRLKPGDAEGTAFLDQVLAAGSGGQEGRPGPGAPPAAPIEVVARTRDGRFWVRSEPGGDRRAPTGSGPLRPLFVKGVNMGVALPGRFPAEFPQDGPTYGGWLRDVSEMGGNAVRLYTLLPPAFYAALLSHNRAGGSKPLWLLQGVWTELPAGDDYDGGPFENGFREEIRRVVDAVHGNLELPARPGHASGAYRADVSRYALAYVLGREWEPHSVRAYDARFARADRASFLGDYFTARIEAGATPFEQWLARTMDFTVGYETETYRQQRPISFTSWPTLDPLRHPTESTPAEEAEALGRRGESDQADMIREYEECEDCVSVDAAHIVATARAQGGGFATYHAYPYYPDFMNQDPGYGRARDSQGPSNYVGYLRDLKRHHGAQPVLIGEVGVPSSRGVAHQQPQGWHHGGHSEREMGEIDARLVRDIDEAGLAGGVLFALLDEWFKRSWLVSDFERPALRKPLWLNVLDPEENYGILATRPGESGWRVTIDGRPGDWNGVAPLLSRPEGGPERRFGDGHDAARTLRGLTVTSDEAYLYIRLDVDRLDADGDGAPDWGHVAYLIGIDTYDPERGDHRLPISDRAASPAGLEFCVILDGADTARLLVDVPYDIQTHRHRRPYGSIRNDDGRFMEIRAETNRRRVARDGGIIPALQWNVSPLLHASMDARDRDHSTLADWRAGVDGNLIEVRLGWGLLNVTDPSSRRVLHDGATDRGEVSTVETPGFRFYVAAVEPEGPAGGPTPIAARLADRLPPGDLSRPEELPIYTWPAWDRPTYRVERKEAWEILKRGLATIPSVGREP